MYYAACWHCEKSVVNYDVCFKIKTKIARKSDIDGLDLQTNIPIIYMKLLTDRYLKCYM